MQQSISTSNTIPGRCQCRPWIRFIVLVFLCIMGFCGMAVYDIPGSLQTAIIKAYGLSEFKFSLLYSFYSWPSVVICFFGGFLIDRFFGVKLASTLFAIIQILGVSLFVLGGFLDELWIMLLGRFVFGIGGEMCGVCVNIYVLLWFRGKELNTVFAIIQNVLRLGTAGVYLVSTPLFASLQHNLSFTEALNFTLMILCSITSLPLILSIILMFMKPGQYESNKIKGKEDDTLLINDIKVSDIKQLPITFWILCITTNLYYHALYTFMAFTQELFSTNFKLSVENANQISSLFNLIPIVLSTLLGIIVDRVGRNLFFMISAAIVAIAAHTFTMLNFSPYVIIVTFSISISLMISSALPTIAYAVDKAHQGTAYGINQSAFNFISSCGALIAGWIINDYGFQSVEIYYLVCTSTVLCSFILLWRLDRNSNNILNLSSEERNKL